MLNAVILSVIMLSVLCCSFPECHHVVSQNAERHYAELSDAEIHYLKCVVLSYTRLSVIIVMQSVTMLRVIIATSSLRSVIMLCVVSLWKGPLCQVSFCKVSWHLLSIVRLPN